MIICYLFAYQLGAGPLPFIYITDTCYDAGMSFATISHWFWMLIVTMIAPFMIMSKTFGIAGTFMCLCGTTLFGFLFSFFILKETKGLNDDKCKRIFIEEDRNQSRK
jgi:hypothetical protein